MVNYLRYVLLLLITLYCASCGTLCTADTTDVKRDVELFPSSGVSNVVNPEGDTEAGQEFFNNFFHPFLVAVDNALVAVASVNMHSSNLKYTPDILTKYVETTNGDWVDKIMQNNSNSWTTQFVLRFEENTTERYITFNGLAAASSNNEISLLALNISETRNADTGRYDRVYRFKLLVGAISRKENQKLQIKWSPDTSFETWLDAELKHKALVPFLYGHYVFSVGNGGYLFVARVISQNETQFFPQKAHFAFVHVNGTERKLNFLTINDKCSRHYFFVWWKEELVMYAQCGSISLELKKSSDMGKSWTNNNVPFAHLRDTMKDKIDFMSATIDGAPVLLFTETKLRSGVNDTHPKYETYLWMSDGYRVHRVGNVAPANDFGTFKSMVVSNGHLFAVYEKFFADGVVKNFMMHLENELSEIKMVLHSWSNTNALMQALCKSSTALQTLCHTDGLVGFLSHSTSEGSSPEGKGDYQHVGATITQKKGAVARKVANGFQFIGHAGAKWLVGQQTDGQQYNFMKDGLTLVATVTVDGNGRSDDSLLGAVFEGGAQDRHGVGLWCGKEGMFVVTAGTESLKPDNEKRCERGRTYDVALILDQQGTIAVHIDWEPIKRLPQHLKNENTPNILHFYFGADDDQNDA